MNGIRSRNDPFGQRGSHEFLWELDRRWKFSMEFELIPVLGSWNLVHSWRECRLPVRFSFFFFSLFLFFSLHNPKTFSIEENFFWNRVIPSYGLSGNIPREFSELSDLIILYSFYCEISNGVWWSDFFSTISDLHQNQLTGTLPTEWATLPKLQYLWGIPTYNSTNTKRTRKIRKKLTPKIVIWIQIYFLEHCQRSGLDYQC